ncbi:bifunctional pantoate--beta-alanine ligase/(d)CMP kinase [Pannus brasiliensis CCIBt3594]|uniref:Bifunctional pantoate ligase/cytidylate kinase n=1 Tax=Pannus brasiliensis CCIBt3594 TaxID=1427578 RepID=A0AAW9QVA2_9CHRO
MRLFTTIAGTRTFLDSLRPNRTIALVPTMGALHRGHESLIRRAVAEADVAVVSIFVNPLQFGPNEDLSRYPRSLESDRQLCEALGVKVMFAPDNATMGIDDGRSLDEIVRVVPPIAMTERLCGAFRPGHFEGVATIVTRLFQIIRPSIAYFGEKDAQQLAIIRRLVADLNIPVEIRSCPTVREESGLALSSRNRYLSDSEREKATILWLGLRAALSRFQDGERDRTALLDTVRETLALVPDFHEQYVDLVDPLTLNPRSTIEREGLLAIAGYLGNTRLIDNLLLRRRQPTIAIDGPAGAGKSTVTRRVARELGLLYLDTGAMYRAVTWLVMEEGIASGDEAAIAEAVAKARIEFLPPPSVDREPTVKINGRDVTGAIREPEIAARVSAIAAMKAVRERLVGLQREIGRSGGIVVEGRDIGTNVFPDAELKIFLTASPLERAKRRWKDLEQRGRSGISLEKLEQEIRERDHLDSNRPLSPLMKAIDAIEVNTDHLTIEAVTEKIVFLYREKIKIP